MGKEAVDSLTPVQRVMELSSLENPDIKKLIDPEQYLAADPIRRAVLELDAVDRYQAGLAKKSP